MLDVYERSLQRILRRPAPVLLLAMALIVVTAGFVMVVPKSMLPEDVPDSVSYRVQLPGNTSLYSTLQAADALRSRLDRKSTRLNSSHVAIAYAVFCLT